LLVAAAVLVISVWLFRFRDRWFAVVVAWLAINPRGIDTRNNLGLLLAARGASARPRASWIS
jgi:hypothetical protein